MIPPITLVDTVTELMVLPVVVTRSQVALLIGDVKLVNDYLLVDPHMIDGVPLDVHMDEYRA